MSDLPMRPLTRADHGAFEWPELDRSLSIWDGDRVVGTVGASSRQVGVPGGVVPLAGVQLVSVNPTHRRQGLLTRMMRQQLRDIAAAGDEALAGLWAGESPIYHRFGYGVATWRGIGHVRSGSFSPAGAALVAKHRAPIRLVSPEEGVAHARPILEAAVEGTPGMLRRPVVEWARMAGEEGQWWAVTEGAYARYRLEPGAAGTARSVQLDELVALTPPAGAALWRCLLDLDRTDRIRSELLESQPTVTHLLLDPRDVRLRTQDGLWLRVIDVPTALSERTFAAPLDLTLRVHDDLLTGNDGSWRVQVDDLGAATVTATATAPDLELSIRELGAAHLGSTGLSSLAAAGRVAQHTAGSLRAAARAWSWDVPAVGNEVF